MNIDVIDGSNILVDYVHESHLNLFIDRAIYFCFDETRKIRIDSEYVTDIYLEFRKCRINGETIRVPIRLATPLLFNVYVYQTCLFCVTARIIKSISIIIRELIIIREESR